MLSDGTRNKDSCEDDDFKHAPSSFSPKFSSRSTSRFRVKETWARQEVLHRLREMPKVLELLYLHENASDQEILQRFRGVKDVRGELRHCSCEVDDAVLLADLMPAALRAPSPEPACQWLNRPGIQLSLCAALMLLLAGIFAWLAVWKIKQSTEGWIEGKCNFDRFMYESCTRDRCLLGGEARSEARANALLEFRNFSLPVEPDYENPPKMKIKSSHFRCCNPGGNLNCCDMYDASRILFCDNFQHLDDSSGESCTR
jgi:hypothetical protein